MMEMVNNSHGDNCLGLMKMNNSFIFYSFLVFIVLLTSNFLLVYFSLTGNKGLVSHLSYLTLFVLLFNFISYFKKM